MKQVIINVIAPPMKLEDNKILVTCPVCAGTQFEFDLSSEHNEANCKLCRSLIRVKG